MFSYLIAWDFHMLKVIRAIGAGPAGPAATGAIFNQLTHAKIPYELQLVVQLLL